MFGMDVSILVVNWNSKDMLQRCLDCVFASDTEGLLMEVILVDNGSTDGSREMIGDQYPQVKLIANGRNLGFTLANNQAYRESRGRNVLLLNPDTEIPLELVAGLSRFLDSKGDVGAVCPRYLLPDGRFSARFHYNRLPTLMSSLLHFTVAWPLGKRTRWVKSYLMEGESFDGPMPLEQPAAACLMVKRESVDGDLLDNRFPLFFNDVDLCRRIWENGYRIMYLPSYTITHYQSTSVKRLSALDSRRERYVGLLNYFEKHHPAHQFRILQVALFMSVFIENILIVLLEIPRGELGSKRIFPFSWIWSVLVRRRSGF